MVNFINLDENRINNIVLNDWEVGVTDPMLDISSWSSEEVINNDDFMTHKH